MNSKNSYIIIKIFIIFIITFHGEIYFNLILSLTNETFNLNLFLSSFKIKNLNLLKFKFTRDTLKPITSYNKIITFSFLLLLLEISCDQKMKKVRDKEIRDRTNPRDHCLNLQPNAIAVSRVSETKWLSVAMNMNEPSRWYSKARNKIISTFATLLCCFTFSQSTWDYEGT